MGKTDDWGHPLGGGLEEEKEEPKPKINKDTQKWVLARFHNEALRLGHPVYNQEHLKACVRDLYRKHRLTYLEIDALMEQFFVAHEIKIRRHSDVVSLFHSMIGRLMKETDLGRAYGTEPMTKSDQEAANRWAKLKGNHG